MTELTHTRLLIVQANATEREALAGLLVKLGYADIISAADPTGIHQLCLTERPDLVLVDLDASESAFPALSMIQDLELTPEGLPVIGLTGDRSADAREKAVLLGVRDFLSKPIERTELRLRLRNALENRRLRQQLEERSTTCESRPSAISPPRSTPPGKASRSSRPSPITTMTTPTSTPSVLAWAPLSSHRHSSFQSPLSP